MRTSTTCGNADPAIQESRLLWWVTGLMLLWQLGAHVDAWYHSHYGFQIESFLTWPHALLYGSWAGTGAVVILSALGRARRGLPRRAWLPAGYLLVLIGVGLFGFGGILDAAWHALFGFEVRLETLLSPAHLWLVAAFTVALVGLLQAAAESRDRTGIRAYRPALRDMPLLIGFALLFRVLLWSLFYSEPLAVDYASGGAGVSHLGSYQGLALQTDVARVAGVTGLLLHSVLLALLLVTPLRWLHLPGGAVAAIMLWDGVLIVAVTDTWLYLPAVMGAAVVGEALWAWIWHGGLGGPESEPGYWLLGFLMPFIQFALYFTLMAAFGGGITWTAHLVVGAPLMAGFYGLLTAFLAVPPRFLRVKGRIQ